jgi:ubiquinone/menaquinone biosynthesis C-methylase UbiE
MDDADEAEAYEAGDFRDVNLAFARRAVRLCSGRRGRALDLGTGPAEIPVLFCGLAPGWRMTAVDASPAMLRLARRKVGESGLDRRIRVVRGDAKDLRGLHRRFDAVLSNSLLHHLRDPLPFWREVRRLCRPGGVVLVQDLRRPQSRAAARELVRRHAAGDSPLLKQLFYQSLLAAYTPAEVREQLRAAGLDLAVRATTDRHLVVAGRP